MLNSSPPVAAALPITIGSMMPIGCLPSCLPRRTQPACQIVGEAGWPVNRHHTCSRRHCSRQPAARCRAAADALVRQCSRARPPAPTAARRRCRPNSARVSAYRRRRRSGETPQKYRKRSHHMRRMVRSGPSRSQRRDEVSTTRSRRQATRPRRLRQRVNATSSINGIALEAAERLEDGAADEDAPGRRWRCGQARAQVHQRRDQPEQRRRGHAGARRSGRRHVAGSASAARTAASKPGGSRVSACRKSSTSPRAGRRAGVHLRGAAARALSTRSALPRRSPPWRRRCRRRRR